MNKKIRRGIGFFLAAVFAFGMKTTAMAAELPDGDEVQVIDLFDLNDPSLVEVTEVTETARTTSRPTATYDLDAKGAYAYSAYSNNNIMWSKYVFITQDYDGTFVLTANSTNTNYYMTFYNFADGKDYNYKITSTSVTFRSRNMSGWPDSGKFYFGVNTKKTGGAVWVTGAGDTY